LPPAVCSRTLVTGGFVSAAAGIAAGSFVAFDDNGNVVAYSPDSASPVVGVCVKAEHRAGKPSVYTISL
jgi:hypothetical protein